jgi:hypothetical protein|tara:strand:- start:8223 stop:8633 length:411 start_codon:yes stop_codon:yes gene_type:complete
MTGPLGFLSGLIKPVSELVDNLHTSDEERLEAKAVLLQLQTGLMSQTLDYEKQIAQSQRDIIVAETQANSWLTRSWRPVTMLTFVFLVVWSQFTGMEIPDDLWFVIKLGLGGYVGGRSVEKSVSSVIKVMKAKDQV